MELLKEILLIVAAIVFILILVAIAWKILNVPSNDNEFAFKGDKQKIIKSIAELVQRCYIENKDDRKGVICFQGTVEADEAIEPFEILGKVDLSIISLEKIAIPNAMQNNTIIIRYEDEFVYVEAFEGERIRS